MIHDRDPVMNKVVPCEKLSSTKPICKVSNIVYKYIKQKNWFG